MFKLKKIYRHKSINFNTTIYSIDMFPNGNLLLLGEKIQIYDPSFNLIYLNESLEDICYSSCIINNDLFLVCHILNLYLFYKNNNDNDYENENLKLKTVSYKFKIIIKESIIQALFHRFNNLVCKRISKKDIIIYDFNRKKDYQCFVKTVLKANPQSNLVLINDILIFFENFHLLFYNIKFLNRPPQLFYLIDISVNNDEKIIIREFDKDNIIIYNTKLLIKYDFKFKQIKLRLRMDYKNILITKNYILAFDYHNCNLLSKNFCFIQLLKDYWCSYAIGVEQLKGEIALVHVNYRSSKIHVYRKNYIKCIIFTSIRYLIIINFLNIILRYFIYHIKYFNFKKIYEYIFLGLIIWMILVTKRLIFDHLEF